VSQDKEARVRIRINLNGSGRLCKSSNYCPWLQVYQNVKELEERLSGLAVTNEEEVESYSRLWDQLASLGQQFHSFLTRPQYIVPFLQPGRLVKVQNMSGDMFSWV
jgi:hypothetical protein